MKFLHLNRLGSENLEVDHMSHLVASLLKHEYV